MKIAHLILAHSRPEQLGQLVSLLQHPSSHVYIHLDKKTKAADFNYLKENRQVSFIKKNIRVYWAHYSIVQAVLNSFEEIIPEGYDYINVISGQDFPIKSIESFHHFLTINYGKQFISCLSIQKDWPQAAVRLSTYDLPKYKFKGKYKLFGILNKILPEKKFPLPYEMVGSSNWFTITKDAASYILTEIKNNRAIKRFFKYTWAADEIIFSTILYNSSFKNMIKANLMYVDWNWEGASSGNPKVLSQSDLESLKISDKFFARKFDLSVTPTIIDDIHGLIYLRRQNSAF